MECGHLVFSLEKKRGSAPNGNDSCHRNDDRDRNCGAASRPRAWFYRVVRHKGRLHHEPD